MNNIQNLNPNIVSTLATQSGQAQDAKTAAAKEAAPLLSGPSVSVTQPASDLEKLVARLKNENSDRKTSLAKQRLASVLDAYVARYGELSSEQTQILEEITENNASIADQTAELKKALADLTAADAQRVIMEAKLDEVNRAIERAVADGKAHRETVAKLKEQLAKDQDNEDLKAELAKEEATVAALEKEQAGLEKDRQTAIAQLGAQEAKLDSLNAAVDKLKGEIAALEKSNADLGAKLGSQTIANLLAALDDDSASEPTERNVSNAEEEKAKAKAIANDPANVIRDAMDRMAAAILQTIDENRDTTV